MKITGNFTLPPDAAAALSTGNKIEAIKLVRQSMNLGLAEAKAVVEAYESAAARSHAQTRADGTSDDMPIRGDAPRRAIAPGYVKRVGMSPGEVARGNNALQFVFFIVAIVVAIGAYIKFG
jgi:hypothetical protein